MCIATFPIGMWLRRTAASKRELLGALIGPLAFLCGWALLLHGPGVKIGGLVEPLDYVDSLGPLMGFVLGYMYSVLSQRGRPSDQRVERA